MRYRYGILSGIIGIFFSVSAHADDQFLKTAYGVMLGKDSGSLSTASGDNAFTSVEIGKLSDGSEHQTIRAMSEKSPCVITFGISETVSGKEVNNRLATFYFQRAVAYDANVTDKTFNIFINGDAMSCVFTQPADKIPFSRICVDTFHANYPLSSVDEAQKSLVIWNNSVAMMRKLCPTAMR